MLRRRNVLYLVLSSWFLVSIGSAGNDTLLNGTAIYLATGDSFGLYQGYVLGLKSVSGDGSVWLQLTENDRVVKSEVVVDKGYFVYTKNNMTILSVKVGNVYSGSPEQNLVSLYIYQFTDPDKPVPDVTQIMPEDTLNPVNNSRAIRINTPEEPLIWAFGIIFILILFYVLRKLW